MARYDYIRPFPGKAEEVLRLIPRNTADCQGTSLFAPKLVLLNNHEDKWQTWPRSELHLLLIGTFDSSLCIIEDCAYISKQMELCSMNTACQLLNQPQGEKLKSRNKPFWESFCLYIKFVLCASLIKILFDILYYCSFYLPWQTLRKQFLCLFSDFTAARIKEQ